METMEVYEPLGDPRQSLDILVDIIRSLVSQEVAIEIVEGTSSYIIDITPDPDDAPVLVGREGVVIQAIKDLAHALSGKHRISFHINLNC